MTYIVKKGDTLSAIAKRFNRCTTELATVNKLKDPDYIRVGQVLQIPEYEPAPAKKPEAGTEVKPTNNQLYNAFITCLDAIEDLPEFKTLSGLLEED